MLYRLLGSVTCALALTSCIVTYRDFPQVDLEVEPLPRKDISIYYHVDPTAYFDQAVHAVNSPSPRPYGGTLPYPHVLREAYDELNRVFLENRIFSRSIATSTPPEKGLYCSVDVNYILPSWLAENALFVSLTTFTFLPSYGGVPSHIVRYDLYDGKELKEIYRYEIRTKHATWFVFLPFAWVNLFTYDLKDAFRATAYQFFLDAERDGYFKQL